jgi:gamma-glutamylcyclotransferase (GGCT)/AIG2-like uncharacterized protein YtfP
MIVIFSHGKGRTATARHQKHFQPLCITRRHCCWEYTIRLFEQRHPMKHYLFSYGTLQPGLAPPAIAPTVRRLRLLGRAFTYGSLYDLGRYPGAVLHKSGSKVWGSLLALPDAPEILQRLDDYEGFDPAHPAASEFLRMKHSVVLEAGTKTMAAWLYAYNRRPGGAPRIPNGDFDEMLRVRARLQPWQ